MAKPEHWAAVEFQAPSAAWASAVLELRARVEILEAANEARTAEIIRLTNALARQVPDKDKLLSDTLPDAPPADGLVERVADAIAEQATSAGIVNDRPARAAIREVAATARKPRGRPRDPMSWEHVAQWLEREAER